MELENSNATDSEKAKIENLKNKPGKGMIFPLMILKIKNKYLL